MSRTPRPRIGVVVPALDGGGGVPAVARFIKDTVLRSGLYDLKLISLAMAANDPDSSRVLAPSSWLRGARTSTGTWEGATFLNVGAVAGEFEFQRFLPRRALTAALADCDLIQVVAGSPAWGNATMGLGKPVSLHIATRARIERRMRDANPQGLANKWRKGMTEVTDRLDDRALKRADAIQAMNPWLLDYSRKINAGRVVDVRYAPPGLDENLFRPRKDVVAPGDRYILCVARLSDPRKNVGLLLEAYANLPTALRDTVRLVLAGSCGPAEAFWNRADALGLRNRITYVARPELDALVELYQGACVFALPSDEEGFGVVVLEAMACGVPPVATRCGGPDGIITDGEDGFLVPVDDCGALSERLAQLVDDTALNQAMGRKARETIERRFSDPVAGEVFIDIWDRMVHKAGRA